MRAPHRITLRVVLGVSCIAMAAIASASGDNGVPTDGQKIHRCIGLHGEIVFSGDACAATDSAVGAVSGDVPAAPSVATDRCPASAVELRERVVEAIARHDANTIAGMIHWRGVGSTAARSRLRSLRDLAKYELLAVDSADDSGSTPSDDARPPPDGFRVRTGGGDTGGVHEQAFGVEFEGGCYWLVW
ncbi:MAG: hypothetical protein ABIR62_10320 [Dokdonella sp.]|uniref:hypothetical protein n=1 Tax=Dokdonella sp. TaxID=2291710 RepID=UPI00326627FF